MAIRVTCSGCHTRFNVSEQYAGRDGPCPKCKKTITIPKSSEEVVVHEPQRFGPQTATGRAAFKPVFRKETNITAIGWILIISIVTLFLFLALAARLNVENKIDFPMWMLAVGAVILAPAVVFAGYTFLRDQELASFRGRELWLRVLACAAVYAVTWLAMPLMHFAFSNEYHLTSWGVALAIMIGVGTATAALVLELDYLMGILHYGMYLVICIALRWIAGAGPLPGMLEAEAATEEEVAAIATGMERFADVGLQVIEASHQFLATLL